MKNNLAVSVYKSIKFKLNSRKTSIILIAFVIIFTFNYLIAVNINFGKEFSFYGIFFWQMSKCMNLVFTHTLFYLIILDTILLDHKSDIIYIIRQKSRLKVFIISFFSIIAVSIAYVLISITISLLQSINSRCFSHDWDDFLIMNFFDLYTNTSETLNKFILPFLFNLLFYFIAIGLIYMLFLSATGRKSIAYFLTNLINLIGYGIYLSKAASFFKYTLIGNVVLGFGTNKLNITPNPAFWGLSILILGLLSFFAFKRKDI